MEPLRRAGRVGVALCKFAPISIPDAKLDGNRRICFVDLVTGGAAADDSDFSERDCGRAGGTVPRSRSFIAVVQSNSSPANLITADYICPHKQFYGCVVMRQCLSQTTYRIHIRGIFCHHRDNRRSVAMD